MANQETAFGLRPIGLVGNGVNSTGVTQYEIASNNTNPIFQFSLCVPTAAGVLIMRERQVGEPPCSWCSDGRRIR